MARDNAIKTLAGDELHIKALNAALPRDRPIIVEKVARIEKKTFPSSEAFDFATELRKKNTSMLIALKEGSPTEPVGYLVYLRMKRTTLVHKICVAEQERGKGVGKCLIHSLRLLLNTEGDRIQLWVDEARKPARALYDSCGFREIDRCSDYYGVGRTALKMELTVEK